MQSVVVLLQFDEFVEYDVSVKKFHLKPPYFSALMMQSSFIMECLKIVQRSKSLANDRSISACRDVFVSRNDHTLRSSNKDTFTSNKATANVKLFFDHYCLLILVVD